MTREEFLFIMNRGAKEGEGAIKNILRKPDLDAKKEEAASKLLKALSDATAFSSRVAGQTIQTSSDALTNAIGRSGLVGDVDPSLETPINLKERFSIEGINQAPSAMRASLDAFPPGINVGVGLAAELGTGIIPGLGTAKLAAKGAVRGVKALKKLTKIGAHNEEQAIARKALLQDLADAAKISKEKTENELFFSGSGAAEELRLPSAPQASEKLLRESGRNMAFGRPKDPHLQFAKGTGALTPKQFSDKLNLELKTVQEKYQVPEIQEMNLLDAIQEGLVKIDYDKDLPWGSVMKTPQTVIENIKGVDAVTGKHIDDFGRELANEIIFSGGSAAVKSQQLTRATTKAFAKLDDRQAQKVYQFFETESAKATDDPDILNALQTARQGFDESYRIAKEGSIKSGNEIKEYLQNYLPKAVPNHFLQKIANGEDVGGDVWTYIEQLAREQKGSGNKLIQQLRNRMKTDDLKWGVQQLPDGKFVGTLQFSRSGDEALSELLAHADKKTIVDLFNRVTTAQIHKGVLDPSLKKINAAIKDMPSGMKDYVEGAVAESYGLMPRYLKDVDKSSVWKHAGTNTFRKVRETEFVSKFIGNFIIGPTNLTQLPLTIIPEVGYINTARGVGWIANKARTREGKKWLQGFRDRMGIDVIENPMSQGIGDTLANAAAKSSFLTQTDRAMAYYGSLIKYHDGILNGLSPLKAEREARLFIGDKLFTPSVPSMGKLGIMRGTGTGAEAARTLGQLRIFDLRMVGLYADYFQKAVKGNPGPLIRFTTMAQAIAGPEAPLLDYWVTLTGLTSGDEASSEEALSVLKQLSIASKVGMDVSTRMNILNLLRSDSKDPITKQLISSPFISDLNRIKDILKGATQSRPLGEQIRSASKFIPALGKVVELRDALETGYIRDNKLQNVMKYDHNFKNFMKMAFAGRYSIPGVEDTQSYKFRERNFVDEKHARRTNQIKNTLEIAQTKGDREALLSIIEKAVRSNDTGMLRSLYDIMESKAGLSSASPYNNEYQTQFLIKNWRRLPHDELMLKLNGLKPERMAPETQSQYLEMIQKITEERDLNTYLEQRRKLTK